MKDTKYIALVNRSPTLIDRHVCVSENEAYSISLLYWNVINALPYGRKGTSTIVNDFSITHGLQCCAHLPL